MVGIGHGTVFKDRLEIRYYAFILETGGQIITMIASRIVIRDVSKSMDERLVQHGVTRNVTIGSFVHGESDFFPLIALQFPTCDDRKDFC